MVKQINDAEFNAAKASKKYLVVDFFATWCGPCRMLAPITEELSEDFKDKADFYKIDVDENAESAAEFNVESIPLLVIIKDGKEVARHVGFETKYAIRDFFETHMK
ncbi:MAG: thioredoxin [Bacilli bacterium]|jgi:thioredoxin 1|nr:thioredoxin [Bacilli bacterium]